MPIHLNAVSNYSDVLWLQKQKKKKEEIKSAAQTESGEGNVRSRLHKTTRLSKEQEVRWNPIFLKQISRNGGKALA